jgi:hypothetical protein
MLEQDYSATLSSEISKLDRTIKDLEIQLARAVSYREATENALCIFKSLTAAQDIPL